MAWISHSHLALKVEGIGGLALGVLWQESLNTREAVWSGLHLPQNMFSKAKSYHPRVVLKANV